MRVTALVLTCDACPVQFDGSLEDGRRVYIRSRHGGLTVSAGATLQEAVEAGWRGGRGEVLLDIDVDEMATPAEVLALIESSGTLHFPKEVLPR